MAKTNVAADVVTNQIISAMEQGIVPWRKNWKQVFPQNAVTNRRYNGLNFFLLGMTFRSDPRWLTYKQASELGGNVRRGEKSMPVVFWKLFSKEENGKTTSIPFLKYYSVFNIDQIEGVDFPTLATNDNELNVNAEEVISGYKSCEYIEGIGCSPAYHPTADKITMPAISSFDSAEEYYSTRFHETIHSTGHKSRLNRKMDGSFGSASYSQEELIAELGAAMLCNTCGIDNTVENSASYINGWLKALKGDSNLVINAASKAQKAADYILGLNQVTEE